MLHSKNDFGDYPSYTNDQIFGERLDLSQNMRFKTMWYVRPAKAQTSLRSLIRAFASRLNILRMLSY